MWPPRVRLWVWPPRANEVMLGASGRAARHHRAELARRVGLAAPTRSIASSARQLHNRRRQERRTNGCVCVYIQMISNFKFKTPIIFKTPIYFNIYSNSMGLGGFRYVLSAAVWCLVTSGHASCATLVRSTLRCRVYLMYQSSEWPCSDVTRVASAVT